MLVIVPDGRSALPFAALVGEDGRFLVQRTRLSIAPALAYSHARRRRSDNDLSVVAASLQRESRCRRGPSSRSRGTAEEAQIAAGSACGSTSSISQGRAGHGAVGPADRHPPSRHPRRVQRPFGPRLHRRQRRGDPALRAARPDLGQPPPRRRPRPAHPQRLRDRGRRRRGEHGPRRRGGPGRRAQRHRLALAGRRHRHRRADAPVLQPIPNGRSRSEALREAQLALLEGGGNNAQPNVWAAFTLLGAWR